METPALAPAGTVEINGLSVPYFDTGTEHKGQLPLVLVHGSAGNTAQHFGFLYPMLAQDRRVIALDWQTSLDGSFNVDTIVDQVLGVVEHLLPERDIALLGFSLGAVASMAAAAARPQQVRQLIPVAGWMKSDPQQEIFTRVFTDLFESKSPQLAAYTVLNAFGGPFIGSLPMDQVEQLITMTSLDQSAAAQMALNSKVDISEHIGRITATTLIVGCTHDGLTPIRHSSQLLGAIEDSRLTEIESGHMVLMERPAELLRAVDAFLREPDAHQAGTVIPALVP